MRKKYLPKKKIKEILKFVYERGFMDAQDQTLNRSNDRFFGNPELWEKWREDVFEANFQDLKNILKSLVPSEERK